MVMFVKQDLETGYEGAGGGSSFVSSREGKRLSKGYDERYFRLFNGLNDLIFVHTLAGGSQGNAFIEVNEVACCTLGFSRSQLLGMTPKDIEIPDKDEPAFGIVDHLFAERNLLYLLFETVFVTNDGRQLPVEINSSLCEVEGRPVVLSVARDISDRKRVDEALRASEERFRSIFEHAGVGIGTISREGHFLQANRALCEFLGYSASELKTLSVRDVARSKTQEPLWAACPGALSGQRSVAKTEETFRRKDGVEVFGKVSNVWLHDKDGQLAYGVALIQDMTERRRFQTELHEKQLRLNHLARHDTLTGLPNGALFQELLTHAIANARRSGTQVAVFFLDLDRFKQINATLGHGTGDQVLSEIARRLSNCLRETDTVARLGGDVFVVALGQVRNINDVTTVVRKVIDALQRPLRHADLELYLNSNVGISLFPSDEQEAEGLMKCADAALCRAKAEGGNTYQFYTPDMNARAQDLLLLEGSLRKAVKQDEMVLYYQPQVDLTSGGLVGMEALIRWRHPEKGLVPPDEFIPIAEETDLILPIGEWGLHAACVQNKAWQRAGYPAFRVAVNISARQFRQPGFAAMVARILEETGLEPRWLELEITESVVMEDVAQTVETLNELKRKGINIAIDDFGTGYSSLAYLQRLPVSKLKIDKAFVSNITTDPNDLSIATAVIALARSLHLQVIAEGVETEEQLRLLVAKGCHEAQGFLFGRPAAAGNLSDLLSGVSPQKVMVC